MSATNNSYENAVESLEREMSIRFRNEATAFSPDTWTAKNLNNPMGVLFPCGDILDLLAAEAAKAEVALAKARRDRDVFGDQCRASQAAHEAKVAAAKSKAERERLSKARARALDSMAGGAAFYEGEVRKAEGRSIALTMAAHAVGNAATKRISDALKRALIPEGCPARGYLATV